MLRNTPPDNHFDHPPPVQLRRQKNHHDPFLFNPNPHHKNTANKPGHLPRQQKNKPHHHVLRLNTQLYRKKPVALHPPVLPNLQLRQQKRFIPLQHRTAPYRRKTAKRVGHPSDLSQPQARVRHDVCRRLNLPTKPYWPKAANEFVSFAPTHQSAVPTILENADDLPPQPQKTKTVPATDRPKE